MEYVAIAIAVSVVAFIGYRIVKARKAGTKSGGKGGSGRTNETRVK